MTSTLVVDAGVALKWGAVEEDSELAEAMLDRGATLRAPAFIFVELANALWFHMRTGKLDAAEAAGCMRDLRDALLQLWDGEEPLPSALEWAHRLDHAVYDCGRQKNSIAGGHPQRGLGQGLRQEPLDHDAGVRPRDWSPVPVLPDQIGAVGHRATTELFLPGSKYFERLVLGVTRGCRLQWPEPWPEASADCAAPAP